MRLIDADELIKDRLENDMVRIAAMCAPTAFDVNMLISAINDMMQSVKYAPHKFCKNMSCEHCASHSCNDCVADMIIGLIKSQMEVKNE